MRITWKADVRPEPCASVGGNRSRCGSGCGAVRPGVRGCKPPAGRWPPTGIRRINARCCLRARFRYDELRDHRGAAPSGKEGSRRARAATGRGHPPAAAWLADDAMSGASHHCCDPILARHRVYSPPMGPDFPPRAKTWIRGAPARGAPGDRHALAGRNHRAGLKHPAGREPSGPCRTLSHASPQRSAVRGVPPA